MPRFSFYVRDGQPILDTDPVELPGEVEAKIEAVRLAGALLRDHGSKFWEHPEWRMWVTDAVGATVCSLRFTVDQT